jgi:lipopolysaccharide/colanic/teichoic acid biosynthesis glycosyltransferase
MRISNARESLTLFIGDIFFLISALYIMLFLRFGRVPEEELFMHHLFAFSLLFIATVFIFYVAGLYERHTVILRSRLPHIILRAQVISSIVAVLFFYFVPYFGISPKTNLFIYLIISFLLILGWRLYLYSFVLSTRATAAVLISSGKEMSELSHEINRNANYGMRFVSIIDIEKGTSEDIEKLVHETVKFNTASIIVIDLEHDKIRAILPSLYDLIFEGVRFVAMYKVYEDVFKRVPFSILQYNWFLENISTSPKFVYDTFKRGVDIVLSVLIGIPSLLIYPFVLLALKMENKASLFIVQERIGRGGKKINIIKFGSMTTNDRGIWVQEKDTRITKVGNILRKSRIDELPQLWNVFKGDLSLIGPRPDIYDLGQQLAASIPYYTVRSTIQPGLSGWAQINQELPPHSLEETKMRLAYDLYYVKNRSIILDVRIIAKTIRTLLSRSGK